MKHITILKVAHVRTLCSVQYSRPEDHINPFSSSDAASRSMAGIILKNNIKAQYLGYSEEVKQYIKMEILHAISDPAPLIRATVGMIITSIVQVADFSSWPELLPSLYQLLDSQDLYTLEVCVCACAHVHVCVRVQKYCTSIAYSSPFHTLCCLYFIKYHGQ